MTAPVAQDTGDFRAAFFPAPFDAFCCPRAIIDAAVLLTCRAVSKQSRCCDCIPVRCLHQASTASRFWTPPSIRRLPPTTSMVRSWASPLPHTLLNELADFPAVYAFYLSYHQSPVNLAIHAVAVPALSIAILLVLAATTSSSTPPRGAKHPPPPTLLGLDAGAALAAAYTAYYTTVAPALAPFAAAILATLWATARGVRVALRTRRRAVGVAAALAAAAEAAMIVGHFWYERRANAVVHGAAKAVAGAPVLIYVELALRGGWFRGVLERNAAVAAAAVLAAA